MYKFESIKIFPHLDKQTTTGFFASCDTHSLLVANFITPHGVVMRMQLNCVNGYTVQAYYSEGYWFTYHTLRDNRLSTHPSVFDNITSLILHYLAK